MQEIRRKSLIPLRVAEQGIRRMALVRRVAGHGIQRKPWASQIVVERETAVRSRPVACLSEELQAQLGMVFRARLSEELQAQLERVCRARQPLQMARTKRGVSAATTG